jgi:hypothetical protein
MSRRSFDDIYNCFKEKGCCLNITKEKYDTLKSPMTEVVSFKASCGHDNTATLTNFIHKSTGLLCKACMVQNVTQKLKDLNVSDETSKNVEYNGFKAISKMLEDDFYIERTNEGCLADMIIKPKYVENDRWMMIQLKITSKLCHNLYSFSFHNQTYEDCLIICYCLKDEKLWTFHYTEVYEKVKLNIGRTYRSEFFKNLIPIEQFNDYMHFEYIKYNKFNEDVCVMPIGICQQQELTYRKFREEKLGYLPFKYPKLEGGKTDFLINDFTIQEKVASIRKDRENNYTACIYRTNRKENKRCYYLGDNDFYWIWLKDNFTNFFIIPENVLHEKDVIGDENESHKGKSINLTLDGWAKSYLFDMTKENLKSKLLKLFKMNELS